jgi:hypothetical protein
MHAIVLMSALAASGGLFGPRVAATTCTTGQCPGATVYTQSAPAQYVAQAPTLVVQPAAPVYAYPAPAPAPVTYAAPTTRRLGRGRMAVVYSMPTGCPNGSCPRR